MTTLIFKTKVAFDIHNRISSIIKQVSYMRKTAKTNKEYVILKDCADALISALGDIEDAYAELKEE